MKIGFKQVAENELDLDGYASNLGVLVSLLDALGTDIITVPPLRTEFRLAARAEGQCVGIRRSHGSGIGRRPYRKIGQCVGQFFLKRAD